MREVPVGDLDPDLDLDLFGKRSRTRTVWLVVAKLLHYRVRLVLWMASNVRCISSTR